MELVELEALLDNLLVETIHFQFWYVILHEFRDICQSRKNKEFEKHLLARFVQMILVARGLLSSHIRYAFVLKLRMRDFCLVVLTFFILIYFHFEHRRFLVIFEVEFAILKSSSCVSDMLDCASLLS